MRSPCADVARVHASCPTPLGPVPSRAAIMLPLSSPAAASRTVLTSLLDPASSLRQGLPLCVHVLPLNGRELGPLRMAQDSDPTRHQPVTSRSAGRSGVGSKHACNVTGPQMPYTSIYPPEPPGHGAGRLLRTRSCRKSALRALMLLFHKAAKSPPGITQMQEHECMFTPTTDQRLNACWSPLVDHDPTVSQTTTKDDHHLTKTQNPRRPKPVCPAARGPTIEDHPFAPCRNSSYEPPHICQLPDRRDTYSRLASRRPRLVHT